MKKNKKIISAIIAATTLLPTFLNTSSKAGEYKGIGNIERKTTVSDDNKPSLGSGKIKQKDNTKAVLIGFGIIFATILTATGITVFAFKKGSQAAINLYKQYFDDVKLLHNFSNMNEIHFYFIEGIPKGVSGSKENVSLLLKNDGSQLNKNEIKKILNFFSGIKNGLKSLNFYVSRGIREQFFNGFCCQNNSICNYFIDFIKKEPFDNIDDDNLILRFEDNLKKIVGHSNVIIVKDSEFESKQFTTISELNKSNNVADNFAYESVNKILFDGLEELKSIFQELNFVKDYVSVSSKNVPLGIVNFTKNDLDLIYNKRSNSFVNDSDLLDVVEKFKKLKSYIETSSQNKALGKILDDGLRDILGDYDRGINRLKGSITNDSIDLDLLKSVIMETTVSDRKVEIKGADGNFDYNTLKFMLNSSEKTQNDIATLIDYMLKNEYVVFEDAINSLNIYSGHHYFNVTKIPTDAGEQQIRGLCHNRNILSEDDVSNFILLHLNTLGTLFNSGNNLLISFAKNKLLNGFCNGNNIFCDKLIEAIKSGNLSVNDLYDIYEQLNYNKKIAWEFDISKTNNLLSCTNNLDINFIGVRIYNSVNDSTKRQLSAYVPANTSSFFQNILNNTKFIYKIDNEIYCFDGSGSFNNFVDSFKIFLRSFAGDPVNVDNFFNAYHNGVYNGAEIGSIRSAVLNISSLNDDAIFDLSSSICRNIEKKVRKTSLMLDYDDFPDDSEMKLKEPILRKIFENDTKKTNILNFYYFLSNHKIKICDAGFTDQMVKSEAFFNTKTNSSSNVGAQLADFINYDGINSIVDGDGGFKSLEFLNKVFNRSNKENLYVLDIFGVLVKSALFYSAYMNPGFSYQYTLYNSILISMRKNTNKYLDVIKTHIRNYDELPDKTDLIDSKLTSLSSRDFLFEVSNNNASYPTFGKDLRYITEHKDISLCPLDNLTDVLTFDRSTTSYSNSNYIDLGDFLNPGEIGNISKLYVDGFYY